MRLSISILAAFLAFGTLSVQAQDTTAQSDYQIQKEFRAQYNKLQQKVDTVSSVDSAQVLIESIKELNSNYQEHAELLNQALFPDSYEQEMKELRRSSTMTLERLKETEQRMKKLESLQTQLSTYEQDLQQLNQRTDSLQQAMQASIQSEKELSGMVRNYRNSLEERDELIQAFIDSMVVAYQQMDLQSLQNLENIKGKSQLESEGNALRLIHEITMENLEILQNNSDRLRLQDYIRMSEVQQEFARMWNSLGDKITEIYSGENSEKLASEIEQNINQWNQELRNQTFTALSDSLSAQGIKIQEFASAESLYTSLNTYLENQISQSREGASEAGYEQYQEFQDFWNQMELEWGSSLVDAGILTNQQMAELNAKVDAWAENAQPESNLLLYLLGASVLLIIILGVLFIRERQNKGDNY